MTFSDFWPTPNSVTLNKFHHYMKLAKAHMSVNILFSVTISHNDNVLGLQVPAAEDSGPSSNMAMLVAEIGRKLIFPNR